MGAGLARERERSSRQDSRDISNTGTNNATGMDISSDSDDIHTNINI